MSCTSGIRGGSGGEGENKAMRGFPSHYGMGWIYVYRFDR